MEYNLGNVRDVIITPESISCTQFHQADDCKCIHVWTFSPFFSVSPRLFLKETMRPFYKFHIPFSLRRSALTYQSYSNFPPAGLIPSAAGWESPLPYVHTHTHHHHHPDSLQPRQARLIKECLPHLTALSFFLFCFTSFICLQAPCRIWPAFTQ